MYFPHDVSMVLDSLLKFLTLSMTISKMFHSGDEWLPYEIMQEPSVYYLTERYPFAVVGDTLTMLHYLISESKLVCWTSDDHIVKEYVSIFSV